jgi:hypothetical protein
MNSDRRFKSLYLFFFVFGFPKLVSIGCGDGISRGKTIADAETARNGDHYRECPVSDSGRRWVFEGDCDLHSFRMNGETSLEILRSKIARKWFL